MQLKIHVIPILLAPTEQTVIPPTPKRTRRSNTIVDDTDEE